MKHEIEQLVAEVAGRYADRRTQLFSVQVDSADAQSARLSGKVLEQDGLDSLREAMAARFPAVRVDDSAVRVLRHDPPDLHIVATNLTDLHVDSSFLSELMTQLTHGMAVEVLEVKEKWCFVRQADGYLGWAYGPYLAVGAAARSTHVVAANVLPVLAERDAAATPVTRLPGGTCLTIAESRERWARLEFAGGTLPGGWADAARLREIGSLDRSASATRARMVDDARQYTGVYYLWGGGSAFGIDCSGFAQLVHRLSGISIPRDADMQFAAGRAVESDYQPGDLLFFSGEHNRRKISHVGISLGGWRMIHSSRSRNGVYEDDVQAVPHLRDSFAGARTFL